jgi:Sel1 repeat
LADQGNAQGQASLGYFYEKGLGGLLKDEHEAARLWRLTADQGNAVGQASLGFFYEIGRGGLPKDAREAARLCKLSADQSNPTWQLYLAALYRRGLAALPKDDGEAARRHNPSADQGDESANNKFVGSNIEANAPHASKAPSDVSAGPAKFAAEGPGSWATPTIEHRHSREPD